MNERQGVMNQTPTSLANIALRDERILGVIRILFPIVYPHPPQQRVEV